MAVERKVDLDEPSSSNNKEWSLDVIINLSIHREEVFQVGHGLKIKLVKKFIDLFSKDKTGEDLFDVINKNVEEFLMLLICTENTVVNDDELVATLFFNGCAILQFIHSYINKKLEEFEIVTVQRRQMMDEVFKDVQIPFRVLDFLVNSTNQPKQLKIDVIKFIHINNITKVSQYQVMSDGTCLAQWNDIVKIKVQEPHVVDLRYLLYLLITSLDGHTFSTNNDRKNKEDTHQHVLCIPSFSWKRPKSRDLEATGYDITDNHGFFRNVEELKSAGIEFEPSGCSLADISFSNSCFHLKGHLKLPPMIMDEKTRSKLEHMACYEESIDDQRYVVTSYLKFMDILIDSEQDVKELRASRILQNRLSSDKDVADWINECGSNLREPPQDYYSKVKTQIQTHCRRKGAIWMSQVYRQHFSNPWAIIGLIAAVMILSLTTIQTVFTINPKK